MKKVIYVLTACIVMLTVSCTSSEMVEGTYEGEVLHDTHTNTGATLFVTKVDDANVNMAITNQYFSASAPNTLLIDKSSSIDVMYQNASAPSGQLISLTGEYIKSTHRIYLNYELSTGVSSSVTGSFDGTKK